MGVGLSTSGCVGALPAHYLDFEFGADAETACGPPAFALPCWRVLHSCCVAPPVLAAPRCRTLRSP